MLSVLRATLVLAGVVLASVDGFEYRALDQVYSDACGYAPLCGTAPSEVPPPLVGTPAEFSFDECCTLADTKPVKPEECDIINPNGEAFRVITMQEPICEANQCSEECELNIVTILPSYQIPDESLCCDSCTCYGDPECIPFGEDYVKRQRKIWVLCDGRTPPTSDTGHDRCLITNATCLEQKDSFGNACVYNPDANPDGKNWNVGKKGSQCTPNPASPASSIVMYEADTYRMIITQGERGIIEEVSIRTDCGTFNLTAESCMDNDEDNSWTVEGPLKELPDFFERSMVVESKDIRWSIVDPTTQISAQIRCHGNVYAGDDFVYSKRMNVEDLSEPFYTDRASTSGFCVSGEFDTGLATTENTENIEDQALCTAGQTNLDILKNYRAICQSPSLTRSGIVGCANCFCKTYGYVGTYAGNVTACEDGLDADQSVGFCTALNSNADKIDECLTSWEQAGPVATVDIYLSPKTRPVKCANSWAELPTDLDKCIQGVELQFLSENDEWVTLKGFPVDMPPCDGIASGFSVDSCTEPEIFSNKIRLIQRTNQYECAPSTRCTSTDGMITTISLNTPTYAPTKNPTSSPTFSPTPIPSCPSVPSDKTFFDLKLCEGVILVNDLNEQGPIKQDESLKFAIGVNNAGTFDGSPLKLYIQNADKKYEAGDSQMNGLKTVDDNCNYVNVNLKCDTSADLQYTFRNDDFDTVQVPSVDLSFFNICKEGGKTMYLITCDQEILYPSSTTLDVTDVGGGCKKITATEDCEELPVEPDRYTESQGNKIIQGLFIGKDMATVTIGVQGNDGSDDCGMNFPVAGYSVECIPANIPPTLPPTTFPTTPNVWPKKESL